MRELQELIEQLVGLLEQDFQGFEQLWTVRKDILRLIYLAGIECTTLAESRTAYDASCAGIIECLKREECNPADYLNALRDLLCVIEDYKEKYDYYAELNDGEMAWSIINENPTMTNTTRRLSKDYDRFVNMLFDGKNFAIIRCADGEYCFMNGLPAHAAENWTAPPKMTNLGRAIKKSIEYSDSNYYYGVSCPCCDPKVYFWYLKNVGNVGNITFSNIWVNCNYKRFTNDFLKLDRETILIANYRAKDKPIGNLKILNHYAISDDCVSFWDDCAGEMVKQIIDDYGDRKGLLYAVAAGPMSAPIIYELYKNNPENCYIDFGSSLDSWFHETKNRLYMIPGTMYADRDCFLPEPEKYRYPKITAVMSMYKRPETLLKQLEAIENQSIKPCEIILFQDAIDNDVYHIELDDTIKSRFTKIRTAKSNQGVWGRFKYAAEVAEGDYVCLFDDDTIPGVRWFENCYMHMIQKEEIYGTLGIGMIDYRHYPIGEDQKYWRFGWVNPLNHNMEVDFVGHSWFMKLEHLKRIMDDSSEFSSRFKYVGEDAFLSFINRKQGVSTVVPAHYSFNKEFWGSVSGEYGTEKHAISMNIENLSNMRDAIKELVEKGKWDTLQFREIGYLEEYVEYEMKK